jgi:hypothetical protein
MTWRCEYNCCKISVAHYHITTALPEISKYSQMFRIKWSQSSAPTLTRADASSSQLTEMSTSQSSASDTCIVSTARLVHSLLQCCAALSTKEDIHITALHGLARFDTLITSFLILSTPRTLDNLLLRAPAFKAVIIQTLDLLCENAYCCKTFETENMVACSRK